MSVADFHRAMHFSAKRGYEIAYCPSDRLSVRLSVCQSVTFRYCDHIGWNSSKIISRPNSLRPLLGLTPTWAIWCNGNTPKIGAEQGWGQEHKKLQYLRNGERYDQGYNGGLIGSHIRAFDWHQNHDLE